MDSGLAATRRPGMTGWGSSRLRLLLRQRGKRLAFGGEALQERRGLERGIVCLLGVIGETIGDVLQADAVGPEHRTAAIDRPAIAVEPEHADVAPGRRA